MAFNEQEFLAAVDSGLYDPAQYLPKPAVQAQPAPAPKRSGLVRRAVGDTAVGVLQGAMGVGEAVLGAGNLATLGLVGRATDAMGLTGQGGSIDRARAITDEWYSPETQVARQNVAAAEGFMDTLGAYAANPSAIQTDAAGMLPLIGAGGAAAQIAKKVLPGVAARTAGAVGEGAVVAGSIAEDIRSQDPDNIAGMYAAVPAGVLTGVISRKVGKTDVETALATGGAAGAATGGLVRRAASGATSEGAQELLQSSQEQMWTNLGTGEPLLDGVAKAAASGMLLGGVSGAAVSALMKPPVTPGPDAPTEDLDAAVSERLGLPPPAPAAPAAPLALPAPEGVDEPGTRTAYAESVPLKGGVQQMISFPDGSVGTQAQVEAYLTKALKDVPPDQRGARRVELMSELLKGQDAPTTPEMRAFAKSAKAKEQTATRALQGAETRMLAEFDTLSAQAQALGVPESEIPAPIGEFANDKAMPAQGRVMLARQHVARLKDAIARREAELRAEADRTAGDRLMDVEQRRTDALLNKVTPVYPPTQEVQHALQEQEAEAAQEVVAPAAAPAAAAPIIPETPAPKAKKARATKAAPAPAPAPEVQPAPVEELVAEEAAAQEAEDDVLTDDIDANTQEARAAERDLNEVIAEAAQLADTPEMTSAARAAVTAEGIKLQREIADAESAVQTEEEIKAGDLHPKEAMAQRLRQASRADYIRGTLETALATIRALSSTETGVQRPETLAKLTALLNGWPANSASPATKLAWGNAVRTEFKHIWDTPQSLRSEPTAPVASPATKAGVVARLKALFGSASHFTRNVQVFETQAEAVAAGAIAADAPRVAGFAADGKIGLIAENIEEGRELGVFLHEAGVHLGMEGLVGKESMRWLDARIAEWAAQDGSSVEAEAAREAVRRAEASTTDNNAEGRIAYMVEELVNRGVTPQEVAPGSVSTWFRRILAAMKSALAKLGLRAQDFSGSDLVELARGAAGMAMNQAPVASGGARFSEVENPNSPVASVLSRVWDSIKGATTSAAVRKQYLGWISLHHMYRLYGEAQGTWGEKFREAWRLMQEQDGRMNAERVKSSAIESLFHEFEGLKAVKRNPGLVQKVYEFMRDTSQRRIDPRFVLSANPETDGLLRPLKQQKYWTDAETAHKALEGAIAEARKNGRPHEQLDADLAESATHLKAVEAAYSQLNMYYADLGRQGQVNGVNVQAEYLSGYRTAARDWAQFGNVLSEDGKSRKVVHDLYDATERRLKQLGRLELEATAKSIYDTYYSPSQGPRATNVTEMLKQLRTGNMSSEAKVMAKQIDASLLRTYQGPYFHSARWGEFYVRYKDEVGEIVREHFESEADWREAHQKLAAAEDAGEITELQAAKMGDATDRQSVSYRELQGMMAKAEENITGRTDMTKEEKADAIKLVKGTLSRAYIDLLPETSTRSARLLRRNIKGGSAEMRRAFAKRAEAAHLHIAMSEYAPKISAAVRAMQNEAKILSGTKLEGEQNLRDPDAQVIAQQVTDELRKRQDDLANQPDTPWYDLASKANHTFYLAGNPAYLLTNLMQPYQFAAVIGAKYGVLKAARRVASMAGKAKDILKEAGMGKGDFFNPHMDFSDHIREAERKGNHAGLSLDEWKMLDVLNKRGKLDVTMARELGAMSHTQTQNGLAYHAGEKIRALGVFGHYTEAFNRITSALAAYNLATTEGKQTHEDAVEYASSMVDESHLNYAGINRARMIGKHGFLGAATPLVMAFKNYQFQVLELYMRMVRDAYLKAGDPKQAEEAQRQLRGMIAMTGVLAGTMGLPFATMLFAIANAFGDEEDQRSEFRRVVNDAFGPEMGGMFTNGVTRMAGADMQGNIGMQDLMPFSRFLADRRELKDRLPSLITDSTGAFTGMAQSVVLGAGKVLDGQIVEGLQEMAPKFIKGAIGGTKLAVEGQFRDSQGNLLPVDASGWDALLTGMNIRPDVQADRDARNRFMRSEQYLVGKQVSDMRKRYIEARTTGDMETARSILGELVEFNAAHPEHAVKPQSFESGVRTRLTQSAVAQATGTGIMAPINDLPVVQKYQWGLRGE